MQPGAGYLGARVHEILVGNSFMSRSRLLCTMLTWMYTQSDSMGIRDGFYLLAGDLQNSNLADMIITSFPPPQDPPHPVLILS